MKILLVEDDPSIGQFLSATLTAYRYTVDLVTDGQSGLELALQGEYAAILLDVVVPKLDGLSVCRQLRRQGCQTPILILTAKDSDEDAVTGLDAGADDYVVKPCEPSRLIARVRALLRRQGNPLSLPVLTWGALRLEPTLIQVTYQQQVIALSPKEYSLLELFLRHPQRIFSRSGIIDHLWSIDDSPTDAAVTNLIKDLRRKLKAAGMIEELIETVYRLGYRLKTPPKDSLPAEHRQAIAPLAGKAAAEPSNPMQEGLVLMDQVARDFQASLTERIKVLERAAQYLTQPKLIPASPEAADALSQRSTLNALQRERAQREAHRLAGGLGTFGYSRGSDLARSIEQLLSNSAEPSEQLSTQFSELLTALKQEIAKPPVAPASPPATATLPLVLVIDRDRAFTELLQQAAPLRGLQVQVAADDDSVFQGQNPPAAILLSLDKAGGSEGLSCLEKLKAQHPTIPVLTLAEQDCLDERVAAARLGSDRYLLKSAVTTDEVFEAIGQVLPPATLPAAKVLVVDDDPVVLQVLTALLQPWGLQVTPLPNPDQFWQVLTATDPEVLLLDLAMPVFNGIELCHVVRQDAKYSELPILVVTAHTDIETIQQVFAAGADDFIGKPIAGPELVTRVISRIERSRKVERLTKARLQRQLLQQAQPSDAPLDPLTQTVSRRYFEEFLETEWLRLAQEQAALCVLISDMDYFKAYSSTYGRSAGDACLRRVAQVLKDCTDPNRDLIARYGDDQFAVALPHTSLAGALQVAEQIQQAIAALQIPHSSLPNSRYLTLSIGITGSVPSDTKSPKDLMAIADQALHAAKARGRNTYCLYPS